MSTYIRHVTLATGHTSSIEAGDVSGETLARVGPWLAALLESGQSAPLPIAAVAEFTATASVASGGLLVTISGPAVQSGPLAGKAPPLVSLGVAARSRQSAPMWDMLTSPTLRAQGMAVKAKSAPPAPWAAVAIYPTITMHLAALEWLGDLERCIAWAWVNGGCNAKT